MIDELFLAIGAGTPFYIICQDGETTRAMDDGRIRNSSGARTRTAESKVAPVGAYAIPVLGGWQGPPGKAVPYW